MDYEFGKLRRCEECEEKKRLVHFGRVSMKDLPHSNPVCGKCMQKRGVSRKESDLAVKRRNYKSQRKKWASSQLGQLKHRDERRDEDDE
jgi:protein-arginine kinase activator protein McsA